MNKELVKYLAASFEIPNLNWSLQVKLAKTLLNDYKWEELIYALNYYKNKGINIYSLGFLLHKNNMKEPISMYYAETHTNNDGKSGERNRKRIELQQTQYREEYPRSLFTEPTNLN